MSRTCAIASVLLAIGCGDIAGATGGPLAPRAKDLLVQAHGFPVSLARSAPPHSHKRARRCCRHGCLRLVGSANGHGAVQGGVEPYGDGGEAFAEEARTSACGTPACGNKRISCASYRLTTWIGSAARRAKMARTSVHSASSLLGKASGLGGSPSTRRSRNKDRG